jgi:topoisomerase-4 subunit A
VVISLIRKSQDKPSVITNLMQKLAFTQLQAEAIANLRLYRLSNTDVNDLEKELVELKQKISQYELILNDVTYRNNYLKSKLREYKKLFNKPRLSTFSDQEMTINIDQNDIIEDRENYLVVTRDGYLKNIAYKSFLASQYQTLKIKAGDLPIAQFKSNQRHKLILVTNQGNYIVVPVYKIPTTK